MKKLQKNGEGRSTILAVATMLLCVIFSLLFAGCDKDENLTNVKHSEGNTTIVQYDTVVVQGDGITLISTRDDQWGHIHGINSNTGETHDWVFPLGGVDFKVTPHDTAIGTPVVQHVSFVTTVDSTLFDTLEVFHIIKRKITGVDTYDQYSLVAEASWLDGGADCWGYYVPFPSGNGSLNWLSVSGAEDGSDNSWNYTKFTTTYGVGFLGAVQQRYGYKTLKREKGSDVLIDSTITAKGWEPLTYSSYGWPTTAKSWIDVVYNYSQSGQTAPQRKEQILHYGCSVPADTTVIAPDFNLNWASPSLGQVVNLGSTTNNGITVSAKKQNYSVGANGLFTRVFTYSWETAKYGIWDMPSPAFSNHNETHTLTSMSAVTGYDRKKAVNTASASLSYSTTTTSGSAPANTVVMVAASNPDPDPDPVIVDYEIVDEDLTYVNPTTNNSWTKYRAVYSNGTYGTPFTVNINLTNGMSCPALLDIYANCANVQTTGPGTVGAEVLDHQYTNGDFTVYVYKKTFTVNCGMFELIFVGTYEKAVYNPRNHEMPSSAYTYAVSSGSFAPMGQIVENNTTYDQMLWTQYITATLNNHTQQHSGTAEVKCIVNIDRITPDWYGDVVGAYYSRVQKFVGSSFTDNVNFVYTNVIVIMIGGNMNNQVVYARNQATANAHNLPMAPSPNLYISALWNGSAWEPCKINYTGGNENPSTNPTSWTYVNALRDHTVMRGDALGLGIGHVCHPKPTQVFTMSGPVGTLEYPVNNASSSMTGTIVYW